VKPPYLFARYTRYRWCGEKAPTARPGDIMLFGPVPKKIQMDRFVNINRTRKNRCFVGHSLQFGGQMNLGKVRQNVLAINVRIIKTT
jgi:hypothetical protein